MQFDKKHNKHLHAYFKINNTDNGRSYSPPLPKSSRITTSVSNNSHHMAATSAEAKEVRTSRDRKSSKKKKRRRRSYSKSSRSRSRSRSYSRRSRRASSSSHSRSPSRSSKHRDRRSSKRDDCGCNCRCSNSCRKSSKKERHSSKGSNSKINSKSPSNECDQSINFNSINPSYAFNSKPNSLSTQCDDSKKTIKKILNSSVDAKSNGAAPKKKLITLNTGILLKQQPIVKLQSSPGSGSDSDNEIDDRFDKKYEELLTFETHEDERREQRLLKALSDIAAKAKQKIQSITDTSMAKNNNSDKNHNERLVPKPTKIVKKEIARRSHESRDERNSDHKDTEDEDDDDYSPRNKKHASKRSRHDSTSSSSKDDERSQRSSRSPSIPRRRGSPSFLDRRRITSARKKPIPYQRSSPYDSYDEWDSS